MLAAIASDGTIRLWDWVPGKQVRKFGDRENLASRYARLVFAPEGPNLATLTNYGARLWDPATTAELWNLETEPRTQVLACAFAPDGKTLACSTSYRTIVVVDAATGKEVRTMPAQESVADNLIFSSDGKRRIRRPRSKNRRGTGCGPARVLPSRDLAVGDLGMALSPDGKTLIFRALSSTPLFLYLVGGKQVAVFAGHDTAVQGFQFTPDGKQLLTLDGDATIRRAEAGSGRDLGRINLADQFAHGISRDGQVLAVVSRTAPGLVTMTDALGGRALGELQSERGMPPLAFSPDNKILAVRKTLEQAIELNQIPSAKPLYNLTIEASVKSFSPMAMMGLHWARNAAVWRQKRQGWWCWPRRRRPRRQGG
jgi:WD40 repeat protein